VPPWGHGLRLPWDHRGSASDEVAGAPQTVIVPLGSFGIMKMSLLSHKLSITCPPLMSDIYPSVFNKMNYLKDPQWQIFLFRKSDFERN